MWTARDDALWFVDIKRRQLHRYDPASGQRRSFAAPGQCGFVVPSADGTFIAGLQGGLYRFDPATEAFDLLVPVEPDLPGNRLNDGVVDPSGLPVVRVDGRRRAVGERHLLSAGRRRAGPPARLPVPDHQRTGVQLPTAAPATSSTRSTARSGPMTSTRRDNSTAAACSRTSDDDGGYPDGPTVDEDGCVWVGIYGGWCARRYSPGGALVETVAFPVANVTKLAFGGVDRRTLFATTAAQKLGEQALTRQPLAGGLFAWPAPVRGLAGVRISHGI